MESGAKVMNNNESYQLDNFSVSYWVLRADYPSTIAISLLIFS